MLSVAVAIAGGGVTTAGSDSAHAGPHPRAAGQGRRSRRRARSAGSAESASCAAWATRRSEPSANVAVGEEAAFDELYNIALQPAIGAPPTEAGSRTRRRWIHVGGLVTPAVNSHRALVRAARG